MLDVVEREPEVAAAPGCAVLAIVGAVIANAGAAITSVGAVIASVGAAIANAGAAASTHMNPSKLVCGLAKIAIDGFRPRAAAAGA